PARRRPAPGRVSPPPHPPPQEERRQPGYGGLHERTLHPPVLDFTLSLSLGRLVPHSPTLRTILPRDLGLMPSSISCATRASARGRMVPTFTARSPASIIAAIRVRCAVVTLTRKYAPRRGAGGSGHHAGKDGAG